MARAHGDSTRSVKAVGTEPIPGSPIGPVPTSAAAYHLSRDEDAGVDTYGRASNPSWRHLESALAQLEGAAAAVTFGSGMAALSAVLRILAEPGRTVVVPADGYYQVRAYAEEFLAARGAKVVQASCAEMCDAAVGADVVLAETPSNPGLDVVDLHRLALTCRSQGTVLVVDNTTATPLGQQPLSLGADLVVGSATKALSGHHDVLAGYVAGSHPDLVERVLRERLLAGSILGAFEAWLVLRSLGSAGLRFERQCHNAAAVALMLSAHPRCVPCAIPAFPTIRRIRWPQRRCAASEAWCRWNWPTPRRCTRWSNAVSCWSPRRASAVSTPRWTAAPGGVIRSAPVSPGSRWESRTPTTCSATSTRRSAPCDVSGEARGVGAGR